VTNSIFVTWVVALGLIAFAQLATRNIKQVPEGIQNFFEWLVESLRNFLESILGRHLVAKTFWFFATIFIFILCLNWFSLLPGVGTIGWGHFNAEGDFHIDEPLLRGANADLNMTAAMSMIFFVCWIVWAVQSNGVGGVFVHLFGFKGETNSLFMKIGMSVAFFLVGWLEVVSILFRPVSLSFRLYGNIFAGENVLESMSRLVPGLAPIIPIPFYFMELLVGIVQALVFMLLTAVFTLLICSHDESSHSDHH
jgi:F-type H+-transporting ATPase subunit a